MQSPGFTSSDTKLPPTVKPFGNTGSITVLTPELESANDSDGRPTCIKPTQQAMVGGVDNKSVLHIPPNSQILTSQWLLLPVAQCSVHDPLPVVERINKALQEVSGAVKALQVCYQQKIESMSTTERQLVKESEFCQQELTEYKEKCAMVAEFEKELRQCYESQLQHLEEELNKLEEEKKLGDIAHAKEIQSLERQHEEKIEDLTYTIRLQAKHCKEMETNLKKKESKENEVEELREQLDKTQGDVDQLRLTLEQKEKHLKELEHDMKQRETELESLKDELQTQEETVKGLKHRTMLNDKKEVIKQLDRCHDISELVSRLPNVTNQKEQVAITEQISEEMTKIKIATTHRRSISWR